ncbi:MAG TPA: acyl-CoA dehydrogenase [Mycobacteriales bacterium]|jgi:acyl-CoA oxidase|nr:acyl-CoA dehydrogenase [Mycobacteriales bacterium]
MSTNLPSDTIVPPAQIDVRRLRRVLDGRWADAREQVRELLRDPRLAPQLGLSLDEQRQRTLDGLLAVAGTDGPKLMFPKEYGGLDEVGAGVTSFETQAHADLSLLVKCGVQFGLFGGAIRHLGTAGHHERYLREVMNAELLGCFAMTETGHGSDVQSLRTTATYDPSTEEFVIRTPDDDASKNYIGNAARDGRMAVVFAQLETGDESHGVHALMVPIRDANGLTAAGVRIADDGLKAGLNGVDNGRLWFDNVRVPRTALLDRFGAVEPDGTYSSPIDNVNRRFFTMLGTLVQGRISISGSSLSATKNALTIAVRYGNERRQFKAPDDGPEIVVLDYLAHQRVLLPALATTYALTFAQGELVDALHDVQTEAADEQARRRLETFAAGLKATSTWHATATIQACREACGGAGYLAENQLVMLKADTDVFTTFEGDNTVLLQLVAKTLLTNYQAEFGELDTMGTAKFVAEQVADIVIERSGARGIVQRLIDALPGTSDDETSLLDREYQISLLAWREKHVLEGVARRLRKGFENDEDLFEVFNSAQDHLLLAARAHIDARVVEAFDTAISGVTDPSVAALLHRVCDLHALSVIERERGWFLEHNRLTASRSKAVTAAVNDLCRQLRPYADLLIDAFGIPDELITAPIGKRRHRV